MNLSDPDEPPPLEPFNADGNERRPLNGLAVDFMRLSLQDVRPLRMTQEFQGRPLPPHIHVHHDIDNETQHAQVTQQPTQLITLNMTNATVSASLCSSEAALTRPSGPYRLEHLHGVVAVHWHEAYRDRAMHHVVHRTRAGERATDMEFICEPPGGRSATRSQRARRALNFVQHPLIAPLELVSHRDNYFGFLSCMIPVIVRIACATSPLIDFKATVHLPNLPVQCASLLASLLAPECIRSVYHSRHAFLRRARPITSVHY